MGPTWTRPPRLIAHRGASAEAPENTLAAFRRALDLGAEAIELDVHLSRDGVPVVLHDDTLDRTTDGAGPVAARSLGELRRLSAGARFAPEFAAERIPTLDEALDFADGRVLLDVELKTGDHPYPGLVAKLADAVAERGMEDAVLASSFVVDTVREAKERGLATALIVPGAPTAGEIARWSAFADAFGVWDAALTEETVRACRAARRPVYAWTVDDPRRAESLLRDGVAGIITNDVRALAGSLGSP